MTKTRCWVVGSITVVLLGWGCAPNSQMQTADRYPLSLPDPNRHPAPEQPSPTLPELTDSSTLADYLTYAALNNPALEAAFNRWTAALQQVPQAQALPDPQFTYGNFVRQSDMQMNQMASVMQMFPWFGTIEARTDAARAQAQAARQEFQAARLKLAQQVKKEFYEFAYLKQAIDIALQNLDLLKHFEQVARTRYLTAAGTHPDIIRAQIELAKFDEIVVSLQELKKPQTARLNAVLNRPPGRELDWPRHVPFARSDIDYPRLVELLKAHNPQLAELDWLIEVARNELILAQKKFYPDIGLGLEWTQFEKSGAMSGRDALALMFQMNLPLWRDSYQAAQRQAKANVQSATRQKRDTQNTLAAQVADLLYDLEETQRKINLYRDIIPRVEQLINASETAYKAGTVDFLSLIDSQRMLLQYNLDYQRLLADNQQKLAELEMLIGADLPRLPDLKDQSHESQNQ